MENSSNNELREVALHSFYAPKPDESLTSEDYEEGRACGECDQRMVDGECATITCIEHEFTEEEVEELEAMIEYGRGCEAAQADAWRNR